MSLNILRARNFQTLFFIFIFIFFSEELLYYNNVQVQGTESSSTNELFIITSTILENFPFVLWSKAMPLIKVIKRICFS